MPRRIINIARALMQNYALYLAKIERHKKIQAQVARIESWFKVNDSDFRYLNAVASRAIYSDNSGNIVDCPGRELPEKERGRTYFPGSFYRYDGLVEACLTELRKSEADILFIPCSKENSANLARVIIETTARYTGFKVRVD